MHEVRGGATEGFETWTLSSPGGEIEATFVPKAGMLGCSLRHRGEELLHLGGGVTEYVRTRAVAGIPLLHPWANRLACFEFAFAGRKVAVDRDSELVTLDPNGLPIHGLLTGSALWNVASAHADARTATLTAELDFGAHELLLRAFPFPHLLRMQVELADSALTVRTTVAPSGESAVPISFGFHPYLRLPGIDRRQWEIELPVRAQLVLDDQMIPTGATEPVEFPPAALGDRHFDDGFSELVPGAPFVLSGGGRTVRVAFLKDYPYAQVYSPPGASFICFEPMTAPTNALCEGAALPIVLPGDTFSASFRIDISSA